ncbi:hypothetical protein [Acrocarpospora sp. B8E8]|uniref:hypothetical protein n=1 Tax=Acrocarpospora sp. B8E8 TaxID=3153572 RepID=UPI00325E3BFE
MAWGGSGLYVVTLQDVLDTTQLALDLDLETHKLALYDNTVTPNYTTDSAYSSSGEISGTGYTAGGKVVTGTALSASSGILTWDSDNVQWDSSTLTGVRGGEIYADALGGNNLILGIDFGTAYATSDGVLLVTIHANGLLTVDCVP